MRHACTEFKASSNSYSAWAVKLHTLPLLTLAVEFQVLMMMPNGLRCLNISRETLSMARSRVAAPISMTVYESEESIRS